MRFDILTIFPDFFRGPFDYGVVPRAFRSGIASAHTLDLRSFTHDRHRTVDDRPFGGGEGMVLKPQPIYEALESLNLTPKPTRDTTKEVVILLSAQGKRFTQATARRLATLDRVVLICGRYEGVDERVSQLLCDEELSIGDYVLSGGELPAAILIDAVVRLLPGVLGHADSSRYESFGEGDQPDNAGYAEASSTVEHTEASTTLGYPEASATARLPEASTTLGYPEASASGLMETHKIGALAPPRSTNAAAGLLDYPHYTRPADFLNTPVPEVLAEGDHLKIRRWRRQAALAKTLANRPDLLATAELTDADREFLATLDYFPG
jgi:tRNA (guanine37-N1)-methyltransferase